jgi:putative ABC transport system permease protein
MLKNYFKIAWRNLKRNKAFATINVIGLSLGIACCILIFTLVNYHLNFDDFHANKDRIYRIVTEWHEDEVGYSGAVPSPVGKAFRSDYTYAEKVARVIDYPQSLITFKEKDDLKKFEEEQGVVYTEPTFFDIFNFPLIKGNKQTALINPNSAVITHKLAIKYFGKDAEAVGKVIKVNNRTDFTITGILKDLPENTVRSHDIYLSYQNLKDQNPWIANDSSWGGVYSGSQCFVLLKEGTTPQQANTGLAQLVQKNFTGRAAKVWMFKLQPLDDIHFNPNYGGYANKSYLWGLFFIGLFLIITASVNFINLATAQALNRSKEVGIRKVLGSLPSQLFWQFIAETALITLFAVFVAVGFAYLSLPYINNLFETALSLHVFTNFPLLIFLVVTSLIVIFFSGSYPGLVMSRFKPALALKSKLSQKSVGGFSLRRVLVVTQFAISQMLIIGTIIIAMQMHFSKNAELGFNKDAVVMLPLGNDDKARMNTLRTRLSEVAGVEDISLCFRAPASSSNNSTGVTFDTRTEEEHWSINMKAADENYLKTFGLKLIAGRNLIAGDTAREFIVNETFVKKLGIQNPRDVIGKTLGINGNTLRRPIVGVVKDFYNFSFHEEISPICMMTQVSDYGSCAVKLNANNLKSSMVAFERIWNETYPEYFYSYEFVDDTVKEFYELDTIMLKLIQAFAGIAVIIGCLGLYGLVSFMAIRKTKEIGVRKVLGAGVLQLLWLFGKEFTRLLLVAFVVAAPIAWWAMHKYLEDFKYRINIGPGIFITAILFTFLLAAITVSYRSIRAALANPIKSLRTE